MNKKTLDSILFIFIALAVILSAINFSLIASRGEKIKAANLLAEKENQPAKLELIKIAASSCKDCFNIESVVENLKKANVNVTSERTVEFTSSEAKQLISHYSIEKLPTVVVLGEVNKSSVVNLWNQNWQVEMANGTQVSSFYVAVLPPYVDTDGNIRGLVTLTHIIDAACPKCANLTQVINFFKQNNVKFSAENTIDYTSPDARELIAKFGVQKIPALIISKDIIDYPGISQVWNQLNATEKQGFYALHTTVPPYRNLATSMVEGLVSVVYLNDSSCVNCYNVKVNKNILERNFLIVIVNETEIDISADYGKALLKKYNITKVPAILVSPDAGFYSGFVSVWPQVGDVSVDNWYIMRKPEALGTYKDLSAGQIVTPQQGGR